MNEQLAKQILKIFANNPFDAFNHKQISSRIGAGSKAERQEVIRTLQELAEQKHLVEDDHKGKYKINPKSIDDELMPQNYVTGTIDMKQGGKAYVIPEEEGREDIQIAPNNTHHALHGDTVRVLMFPQRKMHKPEGQVVEILKRAKTRFVGVIQKQPRFAFMVSDSRTMPVDIFIHNDDLGGAENGEKVLVEMTEWPERMNNPVGKVVKRLGTPGDNNVEMQSILAEYDFPLDFPAAVEEEAKKIKKPTKKEIAHFVGLGSTSVAESRHDFREVTTFTIDPADAKDFDDALSFRELENGHVEVGVHIADVSYYVKPGSAIDREAYERGTSVYLVDRTIPMLPEKLCNEVCSLRQDEDKLCFSVVMEMDAKGKVYRSWMGKTVICSDRRMAYEEAQEIIESGRWPATGDPKADAVAEAILKLHGIASKLRATRYKGGAINFESQEVKFQLDENAKPIGVYIKESKEANWLIEEFMLLANKTVAEYIGKPTKKSETGSQKPTRTFVYRVHDEPNPEKLNTFVEFVAKLGFSMKTSSRKALAESYNRLFENIAGRGEEHMVDTIAIRTMSKRPLRPRLPLLHPLHLAHPPLSRPDGPPAAGTLSAGREIGQRRRIRRLLPPLLCHGEEGRRCRTHQREIQAGRVSGRQTRPGLPRPYQRREQMGHLCRDRRQQVRGHDTHRKPEGRLLHARRRQLPGHRPPSRTLLQTRIPRAHPRPQG